MLRTWTVVAILGALTALAPAGALAGGSGDTRPDAGAAPALPGLVWHGFLETPLAPVGKLVIAWGEERATCTATAVTATLVLTAAHCVFDEENGLASEVTFVPGATFDRDDIHSLAAPFGTWSAARTFVPNGYAAGDASQDYALVEMAPRADGRTIGTAVQVFPVNPWHRFRKGSRVYAVGYPSSGYWDTADGAYGNGQYACDSRYGGHASRIDGGREVWVSCVMNRGSSGGPWLAHTSNGWSVVGLNNRCFGDGMGSATYCDPVSYWVRSSILGGRFARFFADVQQQAG
jgi:hypothetical protein